MPNTVPPSMPLNTPSDWRTSTPATEAITSGTTPRVNANEVITIGRTRDASGVADRGTPFHTLKSLQSY